MENQDNTKKGSGDAKEEKKAELEIKEKATEEAKEEVKVEKKETKDEAKEECKEQAKEEVKEAKEEAKEETKEETKKEAKQESKDEAKDEATEEKTEGEAEVVEESPEPKELEEDSAADARPKVESSKVGLNMADSTLNVMPVAGGPLVMSLMEGGMQYLLAGTRANVGVKSGRYMFEVTLIESLPQFVGSESSGRAPLAKSVSSSLTPHNLVRVGVSLANSSLFLADDHESISFDSEGYFYAEKKRSRVSEKFGVEQTVAVLLNLQTGSPNVNTVSLFIDGVRVSKPQALPETFVGKVLYPTITYKNVTLNINFGPTAKMPLPFACRMLSNAAATDLELVSETSSSPVSEVLFPVGLPDHGVLDWVDDFLEKHSTYTELSDRKVLDWASKSGVRRPKGYSHRSSNDQPDMGFGIPQLDDGSASRVISRVAPVMRRDYVVAELKGNLIAEERKKALLRFGGHYFRKVAAVLIGEPTEEYKSYVRSRILGEKIAKAEAEKKKKEAEDERKRLHKEHLLRIGEARKATASSAAAKDKADDKAEEDKAEEDKAVEANAEEKAEEKAEDAPMEVEESKPTLTEDEEKLWYRKSDVPDVTQKALAHSYAKFSLPTVEEGFDEIKFIWQPAAESATFITNWLREMKRTQKAEELKPSAWFKTELTKWKDSFNEWKKKATEFKDPVKRKLAQKRHAEEAKKKAEAEMEKKDGEEKEEDAREEKAEPMEINLEDLNPLEVKDVTDVGNGEPLFSKFVYEDWAMLDTRFKLFLLLHAFRRDLDDPDRPSFPEAHLAYYYEKYFGKAFRLKTYNLESFADFIELVQDSVVLNESSGLLEVTLPENTAHDQFVRLAEEHRRDRERRVDAGDETAQLKFNRPTPPPTSDHRGGKDGSKGKSNDRVGKDRRPPPPSDHRHGKDSGKGSKDSGKNRHSGYTSSHDSGRNKYSSSYDSGHSRHSYNDKGYDSRHSSHSAESSYSSRKRSYSSGAVGGEPPKQARTHSYSASRGGSYSSRGDRDGGYSSRRR